MVHCLRLQNVESKPVDPSELMGGPFVKKESLLCAIALPEKCTAALLRCSSAGGRPISFLTAEIQRWLRGDYK